MKHSKNYNILLLSTVVFLTITFSTLCWATSLDTIIEQLSKKGGGIFGVAEEVAKIDDPQLVDKLIPLLSHDEHKAIAAFALGLIGDKRAFDPLVHMLHRDSSFARSYAAAALGELGDVRAVDDLINVTSGDHSVFAKDNTPSWATGSLGKLGTIKAIDFLIRKLNVADEDFRSNAARALGDTGNKRAVSPLIEAFRNGRLSLEFRGGALGKIGGDEAVQFLLNALQDKDKGNREGAAHALGWSKDQRAVEPLIHLLVNDKERYVRARSAAALANIGDKHAVEPLIKALGDEDDYVRKTVATALGNLGDERAIEPLTGLLSDSVDDVRKATMVALKKLNVSEEDIKRGGLNSRDTLNIIVKELAEDSEVCTHLYSKGERRFKAIELSLTITPPLAVPDRAKRLMVQGTMAFKLASDQSGYTEARGYFEEAIKLVPWWADPYYNLSLVNEKLRKFKLAIGCLKFYLSAAPDTPDVDGVREKIYALEFLERRKDEAENHALKARDLVNSKNYTKAVSEAKEAIERDPDNGGAHGWLGLAYMNLEMYKDAVVEMTEALRLTKPDGFDRIYYSSCVIFTNLGWTYHKLGNLKKSINILEEGKGNCMHGDEQLKKFLNRYKKEAGMEVE